MKKLLFLLVVGLILISTPVLAATKYIDSAASGANNGTSWTDAWTSFASVSGLAAGDIVYISGGSSGSSKTYSVTQITKTSGTTGNPITYKIGQTAGHNGTAIFNASTFVDKGYVVVSGDAGDGLMHFQVNLNGWAMNTNSSEIKIEYVNFGTNGLGFYNYGGSKIEVGYCYFKKSYHVSSDNVIYFQISGSSVGDNKIHHNHFETPRKSYGGEGDDVIQGSPNRVSVYNNYFKAYYDSGYTGGQHNDAIQWLAGGYNRIYNNSFVDFSGYAVFLEGYYGNHRYTHVYNNLFIVTDSAILASSGMKAIASGPESGSFARLGYWPEFQEIIYANNTFINYGTKTSISLHNPGAQDSQFISCQVKNNLRLDSGGFELDADVVQSNNVTRSTSGDISATIVSYTQYSSSNDLHLKSTDTAAIDQGTSMATFYTTDKDGDLRGATWDVGAYEYDGESGDVNPTTVSAEADRDTNTASETVTGTASDSDGITAVTWVNSRGGNGTCTGDTEWSCGSITMSNGLNTITVTATDGTYTGSDTIVLTYYETIETASVISITGPQLVYFKANSAFNAKITASVNTTSESSNSFYVDIDTEPVGSTTKQFHITVPTDGYDPVDVRWGTWDVPDAYQSPVVWVLSGSNQILYIREREAGTLIESVTFVSVEAQNPDVTAPSVTISTSNPQSVSTDALTVTGTATDAVWGTGSVCKFRIGAEPDADNGTACTDTTSWSCAATGFASGANTLYVECGDAVPNWSTGSSITVYYTPIPPLSPATVRGVGVGGGSFR